MTCICCWLGFGKYWLDSFKHRSENIKIKKGKERKTEFNLVHITCQHKSIKILWSAHTWEKTENTLFSEIIILFSSCLLHRNPSMWLSNVMYTTIRRYEFTKEQMLSLKLIWFHNISLPPLDIWLLCWASIPRCLFSTDCIELLESKIKTFDYV